MATSRRMTRNVQIGLSHGEKAKKLSYNGFYEEALKELNTALRAFEAENRDGQWDDAVAGVLNNAGYVYLFTGNYHGAEDTFGSALAIKERHGDKHSIAGTLAGLADAYRGQCRFDEAVTVLGDALDIATALKDNALAGTLIASMDALERTRCDMPDASFKKAEFDELYVPKAGADVTARVADLSIAIFENDLTVRADIGFPYLMNDLDGMDPHGSQPFPVMAFLYPKGFDSRLVNFSVTDEEEMTVGASASSFDGILYASSSYHRGGPLPMPACKEYVYTFGAGHVIGWNVGANGWYHIEATIGVVPENGLRLYIAMPFGSVRLRSTSVTLAEPGKWGNETLTCGNFINGRSLDTASAELSHERLLYAGEAMGEFQSETALSLKYGILCLDLKI